MSDRKPAIGAFCFLLTAALWGFFSAYIRLLQPEATPEQQIMLRGLWGIPISFLLLAAGRSGGQEAPSQSDRDKVLGLFRDPAILAFLVLNQITPILFAGAVVAGTINGAVFLMYAGSILSGIAAGSLFFGEPLSLRKGAAIALALLGLSIFCRPISLQQLMNESFALGLFAGICLTGSISLRKCFARKIDPSILIVLQCAAAVIFGGLAQFVRHRYVIPDLSVTGLWCSFGFGAAFVAVSYLLLIGAKHIDIHAGNIILSLELVFAGAIAYFGLNEIPTRAQVSGSLMLILAVIAIHAGSFQKAAVSQE